VHSFVRTVMTTQCLHSRIMFTGKENGSVVAATNYSSFCGTGRLLSGSGFSCNNPNFDVDSSQLHSCHLTPLHNRIFVIC
jgi:hypothetical protein